MRRLVIAVDCDDVLIPTTPFMVDRYNLLYDTVVRLEDAHVAHNPDWAADRMEVHRRLDAIQLSQEYAAQLPSDEAVMAVHQLSRLHELHLVTARPTAVMPVTEAMIDTYFTGCFTSIEHLGPDLAKGTACQKLAADVLIDDNMRHLANARDCGVTYRIWFGQYSWQQDAGVDAQTARCETWHDVIREVERIASVG